jgi:GNAT superfamily N-acetyltransferase
MQRIIRQLRRVGLDINLYYLVREGVQAPDMVWPDLAVDFSSALITLEDLSAVAAFTDWVTVKGLQDRLDKGHLGVVLKDGDQVAGYAWADFDEVNDIDCDYVLQPGEAYLYDAFIAPDYRGHGLASNLRFECYKRLRRAGKHTFYSISSYFNTPAIRFKQKLQAEFIRLYLRLKVGGHVVCQCVLKDYGQPAPGG